MRKVLFCDLDDTLIHTARVYSEKRNQNAEIISQELAIPARDVVDFIEKVEAKMIELFGMNCHRFAYSNQLAYKLLCQNVGKLPDQRLIEAIWRNCETTLTADYQPIEGAVKALKAVNRMGWDIVIWTLGNWWVQLKKILDLNLQNVIFNFHALTEKDERALQSGLEFYSADIAVMVGNSPRSDIYPALQCGIWAVHIPAQTWAYDEYVIDTRNEKYVCIDHIKDLPETLLRIEGLEARQTLVV